MRHCIWNIFTADENFQVAASTAVKYQSPSFTSIFTSIFVFKLCSENIILKFPYGCGYTDPA